jgi:hypothetical protein
MSLDEQMLFYDVERKEVRKNGESRVYTHVHLKDQFPVELTLYAAKMVSHTFTSSITGKPIENISQRIEFHKRTTISTSCRS